MDSEYDEEDEQVELRLQELYLRRASELSLQLAPWQGGSAVTASYSFEPTDSIFSSASTPVNSVLEVHLKQAGLEEYARLRCIACWRVIFLSFWINVHIEVEYQPEGLVKLLLTDGDRFRVECLDASVTVTRNTPRTSV